MNVLRNRDLDRSSVRLVAAVGCSALVCYGLAVPLNYQYIPWEQAWTRFRNVPYLQLGIGRRADWVANILLFIPPAFLWATALAPRRERLTRILAGVLAAVGGMAAAVATEFAQLWFPPRTVSQNDIYAECLGSLVGAALAIGVGERLWGWMRRANAAATPRSLMRSCLTAYLAILIGYAVMPLDLIDSWDQLEVRWRSDKIGWGEVETMAAWRSHAAAGLLFVPVGIRSQWRWPRRPALALIACLTLAALLEGIQVFLFSRYAQGVRVLTGAAGAGVGVALAQRLDLVRLVVPAAKHALHWRWAAATLGSAAALLAAVHWPLPPSTFVAAADWRGLFTPPFVSMYWGSEFQALTAVLTRFAAYVPVGYCCRRSGTGWGTAGLFGTLLSVSIEAVDAWRPDRECDSTDVIGGFLGFVAGYYFADRLGSAAAMTPAPEKIGRSKLRELRPSEASRSSRFCLPRSVRAVGVVSLIFAVGAVVGGATIWLVLRLVTELD